MDALQKSKHYTYADYLTWDGDTRYELIDGVPYLMSPAPGRMHQSISGALFSQLYAFLKGKTCKVFYAPFDVRLDNNTVLQPDLLVVCDHAKLDEKGCQGAPDLVVEILSPSTSGRDKLLKFNKYLEAGVREYWIVDPSDKTVTVHLLKDGQYMTRVYGGAGAAPVQVLDGCQIDLQDVFAK
jgi:Uma2 family endonuclease